MPMKIENCQLGVWPGFRRIRDPENACIHEFIKGESQKLAADKKVLDAGAGKRPYQKYFRHCHYESCDIDQGFYAQQHDFVCTLEEIPREDQRYDVVVLSQVLEHVPHPEKSMKEVARVTKKSGRVLLTVPMNGPLHGEPWHFYQFTHHGISILAKSSGFKVSKVVRIGGLFWFLGKRLRYFPSDLIRRYDPFRAKKRGRSVLLAASVTVFLLPFWMVFKVLFSWILSPISYWLDMIDREKKTTTGWCVVLEKN
jgi:SAM-dependent methyltransferase